MKLLTLFIGILFGLCAAQKEKLLAIEYGQQCELCSGPHCVSHIRLTKDSIAYLGKAEGFMISLYEETVPDSIFKELSGKIIPEDFIKLRAYFRCKDCAMPCLQWIQLFFTKSTKKVTYHPEDIPAQLKELDLSLNKLSLRVRNKIRK
jgi:hypothetical protein